MNRYRDTKCLVQFKVQGFCLDSSMVILTCIFIVTECIIYRIFSIKRRGVYLKLGLVDPAFIRTRRLFGARRLFIKCIFQYWKFIEPRTKIQQKRLKNVKQCHQLCLI